MKNSAQIAKHLRDVFFGGNWTWSDYKQHLNDVSWQKAITKVSSLNSIATLLNHVAYYLHVQIKVLSGGPLEGKDILSFTHPPIEKQEDWELMLQTTWDAVEKLALLIEALPEERLFENFADAKYGNYYRNLLGIIEHSHYHLGQIVLIKKMLLSDFVE